MENEVQPSGSMMDLLEMLKPIQEEAQKKAKKAYRTLLFGVILLNIIVFILGVFVGWLIF